MQSNYILVKLDSSRVIVFAKNSSGYLVNAIATITGSSIVYGTAVVLISSNIQATYHTEAVFDEFHIFLCAGEMSPYNLNPRIYRFAYTNINNDGGLIGISDSDALDGESVFVSTLGGINTKQSGLVTSNDYWVDGDGAIVNYDTGYSIIGKALSATSLLITKGV